MSILTEGTACLLVQQPNFFGYLQDMQTLSDKVHAQGALFVVYADPVSMAMFKPPGDYDADIVASEGHALGVAPTFGGPYVGIFACKQQHIRQMPGRIVGSIVDTEGKLIYVLTLQTREQHIRRERATSNICTSVALIALMSIVFMAANGKKGMRHLAELTYHKAHYLASLIEKIPGYFLPIKDTAFQEFVVQCRGSPLDTNEQLLSKKMISGLDISDQIPNAMLVCVTEVNSRQEIENFAHALAEVAC
jgi:glycine dehydrogenase subunit 1